MAGQTLQWIGFLPGWKEGAPGQRLAAYRDSHDPGRPKVEVSLRYQVGGFWLRREPGAADSHRIVLPQARSSQVPGAPELPVDAFSLALPFGASMDPAQLDVKVLRSVVLEGPFRIPPAAAPHVEGERVTPEKDHAIYLSDAWFPGKVGRCSPPSEVDGLLRTVVELYPLAYAPRSGRLLARAQIALKLVCAVSKGASYMDTLVDWGSPLVKKVVGSQQLLASPSV